MKRLLMCLSGLALAACDASPRPPSDPPWAPARSRATNQQSPSDVVVFREPLLAIRTLGTPIEAPVTVGSRPSPFAIVSDDPSIVTVDADGRLVGHVPGTTRVRARATGSTLLVTVAPPRRLSAEGPSAHRLAGGVAPVSVRPAHPRAIVGAVLSFDAISRGGPLDADWTTSDERVLVHLQGNVFRTAAIGTAQACAHVARRTACTKVRVTR
jgi:hypothetical protein